MDNKNNKTISGSQLRWKIGVLEAKTGKGPSLTRAKRMIEKQQRHQKSALKRGDATKANVGNMGPEELEKQLRELRIKKALQKLHHVRKQLRKLSKTSRALQVQKLNKKIKSNKDKIDNKEKLAAATKEDSSRINLLKNVDLDRCVNMSINKIIDSNPTIADFLGSHRTDLPKLDDKTENILKRVLDYKPLKSLVESATEGFVILLEGRSKQRSKANEVKASASEEEEEEEGSDDEEHKDNAKKTAAGKSKSKKKKELSATSESIFVGSLADFTSDDSDISISDYDEPESQKKKLKRKDRNFDDGNWEDPMFDEIYGTKTKRNRPGQRQRQQKWERKYGKEANHIKINMKEKKEKKERRPQQQPTRPITPKQVPLHPSWEIKQQQKRKIASAKPMGTKITFGEDENDARDPSDFTRNRSSKPGPERPRGTDPANNGNIHPSWAAKLEQKRIMSEIQNQKQGKKIVFDDSD